MCLPPLSLIVDQELSAKIQSEVEMEQEIRDPQKLPASVSDYLDSSSFEVSNHPPRHRSIPALLDANGWRRK